MALHFAITGAKGTGKSTLLRQVETQVPKLNLLRSVRFFKSPGTVAKAQGISLGKDGTDSTHVFFADLHLKAIDHDLDEIRLLDRCLVDHLAYVRKLSSDATLIRMMAELTRVASTKYSMIFIAPLHAALPPLNDETEDIKFRVEIEHEIRSIMEEFSIPTIELPPSQEEAIKMILDTLAYAGSTP